MHPVLEKNESELTSDKKFELDPNEFCQNDIQEDTKRVSFKIPDDSDTEGVSICFSIYHIYFFTQYMDVSEISGFLE